MGDAGAEHPNVALVREAFARSAAGDIDGAMSYWADGARYHAFDANGDQSTDIDDAGEVMRTGQRLLEDHHNAIVEIRAIGDELVMMHLHADAVSRSGEQMHGDFLVVVCVRAGRIRWGCDFIDSSIQNFLDKAWS